MLAVLVCVVLVTMITLSLIKITMAHRTQAQRELWRLQASWLVESGIERAAAKIAANGGYVGETWSVAAEELGGGRAGDVRIVVSAVEGRSDARQVHVEAVFPAGSDQRAKSSKQVTVSARHEAGTAKQTP
jgi:Tfp pilus assembly protein PilV